MNLFSPVQIKLSRSGRAVKGNRLSDITELGVPTVRPAVGALARLAPEPVRYLLNWGRKYSPWVFNFGLACCAIEFIAASMGRHDFIRLRVSPFARRPPQSDLIVLSGTA